MSAFLCCGVKCAFRKSYSLLLCLILFQIALKMISSSKGKSKKYFKATVTWIATTSSLCLSPALSCYHPTIVSPSLQQKEPQSSSTEQSFIFASRLVCKDQNTDCFLEDCSWLSLSGLLLFRRGQHQRTSRNSATAYYLACWSIAAFKLIFRKALPFLDNLQNLPNVRLWLIVALFRFDWHSCPTPVVEATGFDMPLLVSIPVHEPSSGRPWQRLLALWQVMFWQYRFD